MQFVIITTGNLRLVNSLDMVVAEGMKIILKVSKNVTEYVMELFNENSFLNILYWSIIIGIYYNLKHGNKLILYRS